MARRAIIRQLALSIVALLVAAPAHAASLPALAANNGHGPALLYWTKETDADNRKVLLGYMDSGGGVSWFRSWGCGVHTYAEDIAMDDGGAVVIVGNYPYAMQYDYAPTPAFILKFSRDGTLIWERELNWSDHSIRLNAVEVDSYGEIYTTGCAWKYADTPEPEGWYAMQGFVFTCRLDASGEVVWAKRWSRDRNACEHGKGIAVAGGNVAVQAQYWAQDTMGTQMLFYSAADGTTLRSEVLLLPDYFLMPGPLAVNSNGLVTGVCTMRHTLANEVVQDSIIMPCYYSNGTFVAVHSWHNGQNRYAIAHDIAAWDSEFYIAGSLGFMPTPPNPDNPSQWQDYPLALAYDGMILMDSQRYFDDSPKYTNASFTSVAPQDADTVYIAGLASFEDEYHFSEQNSVYSGLGFSSESFAAVTGWEDQACGASSFAITGSNLAWVNSASAQDWLASERVYAGILMLNYEQHIPFAVAKADVNSGGAPLAVTLDASNSTVAAGSIDSYEWYVWRKDPYKVDYPTYDGATVSITLDEPGTYQATVKVTSDDGSESSAYVTVTVT